MISSYGFLLLLTVAWKFVTLEASGLRGARDVDDESDYDDDESSADKQLARMHLNDLMGYTTKEAEDEERSDIETTPEDSKDDADDEAAVDEAVEEEHQGGSDDTHDGDGDGTATLLQNPEGHKHVNLEDAISLKAMQWSTDDTEGTSDNEAGSQAATSGSADDDDDEEDQKVDANDEVDRVELEEMLRSPSNSAALLQTEEKGSDEDEGLDEGSDEDKGLDEGSDEDEGEYEEMESSAEDEADSNEDVDDLDNVDAQAEPTDDNFNDAEEDDFPTREEDDA